MKINIENLTYCYPESKGRALENINIGIDAGEVIFVCGTSGSGKSTLGKCIAGTVPHFYGGTISGEVKINNKPLASMEHSERAKKITVVFQDPERQLFMNKVHREIAFGLENVGINPSQIKRRVWETMQFTNILELWDRDIKTLSGGQKQKVALASAIAYLPECIIFDEPTSQLDPLASEEIIGLITKINKELGITMIIIEQRIEKCFDICDKILLLKNGKVSFFGKREELYELDTIETDNYLPLYMRLSKYMKQISMPISSRETKTMITNRSKEMKNKLIPESIKTKDSKEILIKISGLKVSYGNQEAIKKINSSINKGDLIGVFGPNGAGKTTFLKAIMGLNKYSGSIKILESEVNRLSSSKIGEILGYVSQNPNDYISKDTIYDELKFTLDNFNKKNYEIIDEILKELELFEIKDKNPRDLSGGERQRVAIASVLVNKPEILLLDEPTRGLDLKLKQNLGNILRKLNNNGTTIVLVTHDIEFASEFCNKYLLIFNGEIISEGSREQVLKDGIYYTTFFNKLFRDIDPDIFTLNQAKEWLNANE